MGANQCDINGCVESLEESLSELIQFDQSSLTKWINQVAFENEYSPFDTSSIKTRDAGEFLRYIYEITWEGLPKFRARFENSVVDVINQFHSSKDYTGYRLFRFSMIFLFFIGGTGTGPDSLPGIPKQPLVKICYESLLKMVQSGEYTKQDNHYPAELSIAFEDTFLQSELIDVIRKYAIEKQDMRVKNVCLEGVENPVSAMHFLYSYATLGEFDNQYLPRYFGKFVQIRLNQGRKCWGDAASESNIAIFFMEEFDKFNERHPTIMPELFKEYISKQGQDEVNAALNEAYLEWSDQNLLR